MRTSNLKQIKSTKIRKFKMYSCVALVANNIMVNDACARLACRTPGGISRGPRTEQNKHARKLQKESFCVRQLRMQLGRH